MITEAIRAIREWAATGDRTAPTDATLDPTLSWTTGWPASFSDADGNTPRRRVFNYLFNAITAAIRYFLSSGIPEWDAMIDYPVNAFQVGSDGNLYRSTVATGPTAGNATDPTAGGQSIWERQTTPRTTAVPAAPDAPTATPGNGRLDWSWTCPLDNGAVITSFVFQWRRQGDAWAAVNQSSVNPPHTQSTGLVNGTTYEARVAAVNSEGQGPWSGTGSATPVASAPGRVQQVLLRPSDRAIGVEWTTPDDGGASISTFHIQWKSGVENWSSARQISDASSPGTIPNLVNGTEYDVRVRAVNAEGDGDWSPVVSAAPQVGFRSFTADGVFVWPWTAQMARIVLQGAQGVMASRDATKDIALGGTSWQGAVSDGTTIWFANSTSNMAVAYVASTQARDTAKDIALGSAAWNGGASDGTTLWFVSGSLNAARAYVAATQARDTAKDIALGTGDWEGAASDGTTIWFVERSSNAARAYVAATQARDTAKDIALGAGDWYAAVSNGTTLWFVERSSNEARAYVAATQARDTAKDIALSSATWNGAASDGTTLWFVDDVGDTADAYVAPTVGAPARARIGAATVSGAGGSSGYAAMAVHSVAVQPGGTVEVTVPAGGRAEIVPLY